MRKYGWKRDNLDHRDVKYKLPSVQHLHEGNKLPSRFDLREQYTLPDIYDQGELGSCTANAIAFLYETDMIKQNNLVRFTPSRLFIYYNERVIEDTVDEDCGAQLRNGIKTINQTGVCSEQLWPYDISKFATKPSDECFEKAKKNKSIEYASVTHDIIHLKTALVSGFPIAFGILIYESFESAFVANTGILELPKSNEKCLGGHAVAMIGYDDAKSSFIVRNSWGPNWGMKGHFYLPYSYLTNPSLAADFWIITQVTNPTPSPPPQPPSPPSLTQSIQPTQQVVQTIPTQPTQQPKSQTNVCSCCIIV